MDPHRAIVDHLSPGATLVEVRPLSGGVSASVVAVAFVRPDGAREQIVVRRPVAHDWKPGQPGGIALEHALLVALHARGLPVPRPRLLHEGALVLDFVAGSAALPEGAAGLVADALVALHATDIGGLPPLQEREDPVAELLASRPQPPGLREALEARGAWSGPARLLHGDFWPGNLLWRDGRLAAVVDWEDAAVGDPLSDVACARVELACAAGEDVALAFVERYLARTGLGAARLAVWALYVSTAALASMDHWGLAPEALASRRAATEACRRRALEELGLPTGDRS